MPAADHQVDYALAPTQLTYLDKGSPTTPAYPNDWVELTVHVKSGQSTHPVIGISLASVITGKVSNAKLKWDSDNAANAATEWWVSRLLLTFAQEEATWEERSDGVSWTSDGALTAETDYTETNQVAFVLPVGAPPVAMEHGIESITQDAIDAALSDLMLMMHGKNESIPDGSTWFLRAAGISLELSVTPWLYHEWLNVDEDIDSITETTAMIVVQMGPRTFDANDKLRVAYGTDPTMESGVLYNTPVDVSAKSQGDWVDLPLTGLSRSTQYSYRVEASDDGTIYPHRGDIRAFHTPPLGGPATPPPCIAAGAPCPSHGGR